MYGQFFGVYTCTHLHISPSRGMLDVVPHIDFGSSHSHLLWIVLYFHITTTCQHSIDMAMVSLHFTCGYHACYIGQIQLLELNKT